MSEDELSSSKVVRKKVSRVFDNDGHPGYETTNYFILKCTVMSF